MHRSLAIALAVLVPAAARAERPFSADLRTDLAIHPSASVLMGPSIGLEGSAGLTSQLSFVVGASTARHAIAPDRGGGYLEVTQAGAGFSFLLDAAPVLPIVHAGVMASYRDTGKAHGFGPWPYLGFQLLLPLRQPFTVGLDARYTVTLSSGQAQFGYAQLGLALGVAYGLSRP